ncbi:MAG: glutaredoxin family protein [Gammaproteobacteria bacterium]|nr:glutaredoxin family protein [Gammaproteobacteria bacterium]MCW9089234.1 glutaredoxin family protein [Gammaproteobacteria bacterium]
MKLRLYYRSGCSLCEAMHRELLACEASHSFELECIDIDSSEALRSRYDHMVPVLTDGAEHQICHYFLDLQALEAYFATH